MKTEKAVYFRLLSFCYLLFFSFSFRQKTAWQTFPHAVTVIEPCLKTSVRYAVKITHFSVRSETDTVMIFDFVTLDVKCFTNADVIILHVLSGKDVRNIIVFTGFFYAREKPASVSKFKSRHVIFSRFSCSVFLFPTHQEWSCHCVHWSWSSLSENRMNIRWPCTNLPRT